MCNLYGFKVISISNTSDLEARAKLAATAAVVLGWYNNNFSNLHFDISLDKCITVIGFK